ncbi:hypothetical protein [Xanthobacter versatilis]
MSTQTASTETKPKAPKPAPRPRRTITRKATRVQPSETTRPDREF